MSYDDSYSSGDGGRRLDTFSPAAPTLVGRDEIPVTGGSGPGLFPSGNGYRPHLVKINKARVEELREIPGIGERGAESIIKFRGRHGQVSRSNFKYISRLRGHDRLMEYFDFEESGPVGSAPSAPAAPDPWGPNTHLALEMEYLKRELKHVQRVVFSPGGEGTPARPNSGHGAGSTSLFPGREVRGQTRPEGSTPSSSGGGSPAPSPFPQLGVTGGPSTETGLRDGHLTTPSQGGQGEVIEPARGKVREEWGQGHHTYRSTHIQGGGPRFEDLDRDTEGVEEHTPSHNTGGWGMGESHKGWPFVKGCGTRVTPSQGAVCPEPQVARDDTPLGSRGSEVPWDSGVEGYHMRGAHPQVSQLPQSVQYDGSSSWDALPKSVQYDGSSSWDAFYQRFDKFARASAWSEEECLDQLCWAINGKAADHLALLLEKYPNISYSYLTQRLGKRFGDKDLPETSYLRLQNAVQKEGESLEEWADRVVALAMKAFPHLPEAFVDSQATLQVCQGLADAGVGEQVCNLRPRSVEEALDQIKWHQHNHRSMKCRTLSDPELSGAARRPLRPDSMGPAVRVARNLGVNKESLLVEPASLLEDSKTPKRNTGGQVASPNSQMLDGDSHTLKETVKDMMAILAKMQIRPRDPPQFGSPSPSPGLSRQLSGGCLICGDLGHFKGSAPSVPLRGDLLIVGSHLKMKSQEKWSG